MVIGGVGVVMIVNFKSFQHLLNVLVRKRSIDVHILQIGVLGLSEELRLLLIRKRLSRRDLQLWRFRRVLSLTELIRIERHYF